MTRLAELLENFGAPPAPPPGTGPNPEEIDALKVAAYEEGYKAGWEDAAKAQADDRSQITAEFARNLQDLSFTYHEAHAHLLKSLRPLLEDMVRMVLPRLAEQTLLPRIVEELQSLARGEQPRGVEIVVHPDAAPGLEVALERDLGVPVALVEDPSLAEGQVYLRLGEDERQIDMIAVLDGISDAVAAFLQQTEAEVKHG
ncbi:FliH/SctL family protein [Pseudooceanicola sp. 502str34]